MKKLLKILFCATNILPILSYAPPKMPLLQEAAAVINLDDAALVLAVQACIKREGLGMAQEIVARYQAALVEFMDLLNQTCRYPLQGAKYEMVEVYYLPQAAFGRYLDAVKQMHNLRFLVPASQALDSFRKLPKNLPIEKRDYILDSTFAQLFSMLHGIRAIINDDAIFNMLVLKMFPGGVIRKDAEYQITGYSKYILESSVLMPSTFIKITHAEDILRQNMEIHRMAHGFAAIQQSSYYMAKHYHNRFSQLSMFVTSRLECIAFYPAVYKKEGESGLCSIVDGIRLFADTMQSDVKAWECASVAQTCLAACLAKENVKHPGRYDVVTILNSIRYPQDQMNNVVLAIAKNAEPGDCPNFAKIFEFAYAMCERRARLALSVQAALMQDVQTPAAERENESDGQACSSSSGLRK